MCPLFRVSCEGVTEKAAEIATGWIIKKLFSSILLWNPHEVIEYDQTKKINLNINTFYSEMNAVGHSDDIKMKRAVRALFMYK